MSKIEMINLSYSYPGTEKPILNDINVTIEEGEFIMLTGPSGCGKTTLCRCLNGLIPHFYGGELEGEVSVCGLSVKSNPMSELSQHVGYVFQNPDNQLFALTVEKDVAFGLENLALPRNEIKSNIDWAMEIVGISELRNSSPNELSGGQKQLVAIACVLAMRPRILIMDEPTSNLDPMAAKRMFDVIKSLNEKFGITVVLVEHRLDLLSTYVNRVIVMDEGSIKIDGSPKIVLSSPESQIIGIGIPKVIRLHQEIKNEGFDMGEIPLTVEDFTSAFRRMTQT